MDTFELAIEDGCYHLKELGLEFSEIAQIFGISEDAAKKKRESFARKLKSKQVEVTEFDKKFWEGILQETQGNDRVTLVDDKGRFYHGRRSELESADTKDLMALFDSGKEYLNTVPPMVLETLEKNKPGYNPLSPIKQLKDSLKVLEEILSKRST